MANHRTLSRRHLLRAAGSIAALGPAALLFGCGSSSADEGAAVVAPDGEQPARAAAAAQPAPEPPPPEPFIVPEGVQEHELMAGTPQQTKLYVFGTGQPGKVVLGLGGVHGNEPGGWLAAEYAIDRVRPETGALLVIPRANRLATQWFVRTTDDLGDLNRMYPGDPNGLPMARMAHEIVEAIRAFHVEVVVDMHESWAFYADRPQSGTAFLGQTIATAPTDAGRALGQAVADAVNQRILYRHEEIYFREFPNRNTQQVNPNSGGGRSSLGLPNHFPGLIALLVEMGQQQGLDRRVALHVDVLREVMRQVGIAG